VLTREIVINEIMCNPISHDSADEYVELYNRGAQAMNLENWRLLGGIEFTFPVGTSIPGGGFLVVAKNKGHLLPSYPGLSADQVVGDYSGMLSDNGEWIALAMPEEVRITNANQTVTITLAHSIVDDGPMLTAGGGQVERWRRQQQLIVPRATTGSPLMGRQRRYNHQRMGDDRTRACWIWDMITLPSIACKSCSWEKANASSTHRSIRPVRG
jgi:hypothetical protein